MSARLTERIGSRRTTPGRFNTLAGIAACCLVCLSIACSVEIVPADDGVTVGFTVGTKTFSFTFQDLGPIETQANQTAKVASGFRLFESDPVDMPTAGRMLLPSSSVGVGRRLAGKQIVRSQSLPLNGSATISFYIASGVSADLCDSAVLLAEYEMSLTTGVAAILDEGYVLSPEALDIIASNDVTICIEITADFDGEITLGEFTFTFGDESGNLPAETDDVLPTGTIMQVPIDNVDGSSVSVGATHTINGIPYGVVGVLEAQTSSVDRSQGSPSSISLNLQRLGLQRVDRMYLATYSSFVPDLPNGVRVASLTVSYAEGGRPDKLDFVTGDTTAEWSYDRPEHDNFGGVQHDKISTLYTFETRDNSAYEYTGYCYLMTFAPDPSRTPACMWLEMRDPTEYADGRTLIDLSQINFATDARHTLSAVTLEGPLGDPPTTGSCASNPWTCTTDNDCPAGQVCQNGECVTASPTGCTSDSDCPAGQVCQNGECVAAPSPECTWNSDCPAGQICQNGECVAAPPAGCTSDSDCPTGQVCQNGECVAAPTPECTWNSDCPAGQICQNGACVAASPTGCTSDDDCETGQVCENGECVAAPPTGCTTDADCGTGETCVSGQCVAEPPPAGYTTATILHRGTEHRVAGADVDPALALQISAGYQVADIALSGDGEKLWFILWDEYPDVEGDPQIQLWSVDTDGTNGQRSTISEGHLSAYFFVQTNEDGSVAVTETRVGGSTFAIATPGNATQLLWENAPCSQDLYRLTDDGTRLVYLSHYACSNAIYTGELYGGQPGPELVVAGSEFTAGPLPARNVLDTFDISADGNRWVVATENWGDGRSYTAIAVGTGLTAPTIDYQATPNDWLWSRELSITDDGSMIAYDFGGPGTYDCYAQEVGADSWQTISHPVGETKLENLVMADDGSRTYTDGFFTDIGTGQKAVCGAHWITSQGAQMSEDGKVMAFDLDTNGASVLHDGVDGLDGYPSIDRIAYRFDDAEDALVVRVEFTADSTIQKIYAKPMHSGTDPVNVIPVEQNPLYGIRGASGAFSEVEPGVHEGVIPLEGKKAYLNDSYGIRIVLVEATATQIVFQDFSPTR